MYKQRYGNINRRNKAQIVLKKRAQVKLHNGDFSKHGGYEPRWISRTTQTHETSKQQFLLQVWALNYTVEVWDYT